jgi:hypothetical protein
MIELPQGLIFGDELGKMPGEVGVAWGEGAAE